MTRLFRDQRQQSEAQVALAEHAAAETPAAAAEGAGPALRAEPLMAPSAMTVPEGVAA